MNPAQRQTAEGILFTDAYQLSMAQHYLRMGLHETRVQFDRFFHTCPSYDMHESSFCSIADMETPLDEPGADLLSNVGELSI